jgi:hypothetical protein
MKGPTLLLLPLILLLFAGSLHAQATLTGTVRNDSTGALLPGVEVLLSGTTHRAETDREGRYVVTGLPAGSFMVIFRLVGYLPVRSDVALRPGDTTRANATLIANVVTLNPISVTGTPSTTRGVGIGREAFEERRRMGFGVYFDSTYLRRMEHRRLDDVLFSVPGVKLSLRLKGGGRYIMSARRPDTCFMQVYFDGVPMGRGGVAGRAGVSPVSTAMFSLSSIEKFEIYRSAAEVPLEYGGNNATCGVVLLWSRRGP